MSAREAVPVAPRARPVSQLRPRVVSWLWPWRLGRGKLAILDGDPGLGKSVVTLDLCARLSTGRPWPDGSPIPAAECALVINGEDGDEDTTRPRLERLGADLDRVFVLEGTETEFGPPLTLPGQTEWLESVLEQTRARLVVLDPILAFLSKDVNPASDASVRRALRGLAGLAARYDCAVLLVRHLNKLRGRRALYRGLGSIGLVGMCRSAWLVAADPNLPARRVLAQVKNNLAPPQPSLAFELRGAKGEPPALHWLGPLDAGADALLAEGASRAAQQPCRDRAGEFLLDLLSDGPRTTREIWQEGKALGLSERTLRRAKGDLKIRLVETRREGRKLSYWIMDRQEMPPELVGPDYDPEFENVLRQLREQYPPATPLDDL